MAFENFPYSNFHELNLDWILEKVKEAYSASNPPDYPVKSVNGMTGDVIIAIPANLVQSVNGETGDVILYRNPLIQFPTTDEQRWNLFRICDGDERGIEFDEDGAHRIEGTRRILIYDEENQPDFPVTSVNGQTGDVRITAGVNSVNGKTGNVVTPFVNPNSDILKLDSNSNTVLWGLARDVSGGEIALYITRGTGTPQAFIRYTPTEGQAINLPLLSNADIPAEAGVVSINGKTGVVTLYGTDILTSVDGSTSIYDDIIRVLNENALINDSIQGIIYGSEMLESGGISSSNGQNTTSGTFCRTIDYVPESCIRISDDTPYLKFSVYAYDKTTGRYIGRYTRNNDFQPISTGAVRYLDNTVDMAYFFTQFPNYKFRVIVTIGTSESQTAPTPIESVQNVEFLNSLPKLNIDEINALKNDVDAAEDEIAQLQTEGASRDQQISALQTKDTTHDQQISALQAEDSTLAQQISALQAADDTHNQQISALQAKDNTQDQQIAELHTRTGVYVISIPNANTLPLRYPTSGTDSKIKDTNKVVSMDLSIPGTQVYNWTITTYDGYLEIIGTMNGTSDITLYLA